MGLTELLLALLAPHECLGCGREDHLLCAACYYRLPTAPSVNVAGIDHIWPGVSYQKLARSVIHALKFERAIAAAADVATHMAATLPVQGDWTVTHIPTAPSRIRQRGYDQSQRIARLLAARIGAPYAPLLARTTAVRQVGASRALRHLQMRGAFRTLDGKRPPTQHVLLIDDVLTTGSTMQSAAETLRTAGVKHVSAAVFASA
jgi:competence protein ComFC